MVNSIHGEFESCEFIESIVKRLLESPWCRTWRSIWIHGKSQFTLGCSSIHWVATYLNGWLKISRTPHYLQPETVGPREKATGYAATVKFKCSATSGSQLVQWDSVIFINQKGCCNQNSVPFFNDNCTYMYLWHGTNCNTHFLGTEGSGSAVSNIIRIPYMGMGQN